MSTLMTCLAGNDDIASDWFLNGLNLDPTMPDDSPNYNKQNDTKRIFHYCTSLQSLTNH